MSEQPSPKPFAKLTRSDLERAPIWEWIDETSAQEFEDGADESFVCETCYATIPSRDFGQFIVACEIDLEDGTTMPGIAEVTVARGEVVVEPTQVFLLDRKLQIPGLETNRLLARFTQRVQNHPVAWRLAVCIDAESQRRSGKIAGSDLSDIVRSGLEALSALKALRK